MGIFLKMNTHCQNCGAEMLLEGEDRVCDECGTTYNIKTGAWTEPVVEIKKPEKSLDFLDNVW